MTGELARVTYVRDLDQTFERRQSHARRATRGGEIRAARGAYVDRTEWRALDEIERYLVTIRAISETRRHQMVLSHWSAAALHGLPILGSWPAKVHVTIGRVSGGRSRNDVVKHALPLLDSDVVNVAGLLVTSVARTVLDIATSYDRLTAVMVADRSLLTDRYGSHRPMLTREDPWDCYVSRGNFRGQRRAKAIIEFAATRAESPLESVSRANMWTMGCPIPLLQQSFSDSDGYIGDGDFHWKGLRLVGEADGESKYLDPVFRGGKTAEQVVFAEKYREDRIRATGERVTRWPWSVGVSPQLLRAHLRRAGVPIG
jgi:hypothetical protein